MSDEAPQKDSDPVSVYELMEVIQHYHDAIASLGSCMISVATGLRQSPNDAERGKGEEAWEKLDAFIDALEEATSALKALASRKSNRPADEI